MDSPVAAADPVMSRTSRFWTVSCIQVPAFDRKFATDHQRTLRYLRERHGERDARPEEGAGALFGAGEGAERGAEDTERYPRGERGSQRGRRNRGTPAALHGRST
ncbi:hypothetical protein ALMP_80490 [Streptomyces sp. A012304]|nr:hypothetical protein ALMP_80490 [Streptomyces sp. A012304]